MPRQEVALTVSMQTQGAVGSGRSDAILRAVATSARRFGRDPWEDVIREVLHLLGEAAGVSRAYVFQNSQSPQGALVMSQRFEWIRQGIKPTKYDPGNQNYPYRPEYARWERLLGAGTTIFGVTEDYPEVEQESMREEDVLSAVLMPIFAGTEWWGFIGFDDCAEPRQWVQVELSALEAAAETLGAAIQREEGEKERLGAEAKFQALVENLPGIVYMSGIGEDGDWFFVSEQIKDVLGYTPQEWLDHPGPFKAHLYPGDLDKIIEAENESEASASQIVHMEYRMYTRDRRLIWIRDQARPVRDEAGKTLYLQGVMVDITDHKNAEQERSEAEARFKALVEHIPAIVYTAHSGGDGDWIFVSAQIEQMLGYTAEEWLDHPAPFKEHVHPDDLERVWAEEDAAGASPDGLLQQEYRIYTRDRRLIWVRDQSGPVKDESGKTLYRQGMMIEITEERPAEERLRDLGIGDSPASRRIELRDTP